MSLMVNVVSGAILAEPLRSKHALNCRQNGESVFVRMARCVDARDRPLHQDSGALVGAPRDHEIAI